MIDLKTALVWASIPAAMAAAGAGGGGGVSGPGQAIFGYGATGGSFSITNRVSDTGVVAADTTGVGTVRRLLGGAAYGS